MRNDFYRFALGGCVRGMRLPSIDAIDPLSRMLKLPGHAFPMHPDPLSFDDPDERSNNNWKQRNGEDTSRRYRSIGYN